MFVLAAASVIALLGLIRGLQMNSVCEYLGGIDETCFEPRADVLGVWVPRPVAAVSWLLIGAVVGGALGFGLSRVSNKAYLAAGLGVTLGGALFVTSHALPW
jgi:hypothetical protein